MSAQATKENIIDKSIKAKPLSTLLNETIKEVDSIVPEESMEAKKVAVIRKHALTLSEALKNSKNLTIKKLTEVFQENMFETGELPRTYISTSPLPNVKDTTRNTVIQPSMVSDVLASMKLYTKKKQNRR